RRRGLISKGKLDDAAAVVTRGQPLANRLLAVTRPTLAAMEAASDLDEMYARILLANHNTGWARLTFQKNRSGWSTWKPKTEDTERRRKQAASGIAECDRRLEK